LQQGVDGEWCAVLAERFFVFVTELIAEPEVRIEGCQSGGYRNCFQDFGGSNIVAPGNPGKVIDGWLAPGCAGYGYRSEKFGSPGEFAVVQLTAEIHGDVADSVLGTGQGAKTGG